VRRHRRDRGEALRHADAELVLADRRNHHNFQPLLYQVATVVLSSTEIAAPIRQLEVDRFAAAA
jgi:NADH dehydrogenase